MAGSVYVCVCVIYYSKPYDCLRILMCSIVMADSGGYLLAWSFPCCSFISIARIFVLVVLAMFADADG